MKPQKHRLNIDLDNFIHIIMIYIVVLFKVQNRLMNIQNHLG